MCQPNRNFIRDRTIHRKRISMVLTASQFFSIFNNTCNFSGICQLFEYSSKHILHCSLKTKLIKTKYAEDSSQPNSFAPIKCIYSTPLLQSYYFIYRMFSFLLFLVVGEVNHTGDWYTETCWVCMCLLIIRQCATLTYVTIHKYQSNIGKINSTNQKFSKRWKVNSAERFC